MSSEEWFLVHCTHVEDGLRARQGPYLTLWGQKDRSTVLHLEYMLNFLSPFLMANPPPTDLNVISCQTIVVLINNALVRGRLVETTPSPDGLVDVFCIDLGTVQSVSQAFIRTLDIYGCPTNAAGEVVFVAQCRPLAQKYILADIVSPQELWPDNAIHYAKAVLEKQSWKAYSLGNHGDATEVRLYNSQNKPLAQTMIERGIGIPAPVPMVEASGASFPPNNFARPVLQANSSARGVPSQTLPTRIEPLHPIKHFPSPIASIAQLPSTSRLSVQIAHQSIQPEEQLFVTAVQSVGRFFGQLERLPIDDLNQIQGELLKVYGSLNDPPLLYADVNSHVGDFAVIKFSEDGQYYRVKIHEEFVNEAEVWFVDYGNVLKVLKREVLAPVSALSLFAKPTFGIYCQLSTAVASPEKWEVSLLDRSIHVRINDCKNDLYFVTFIHNSLNKRLLDALNISAASNQTAPQVRTPAANPSSFISPPVGKGCAATVLSNSHADTPPEIRAQTYTSCDTPPSQQEWDTSPTLSWETPSAPVKTAAPSS